MRTERNHVQPGVVLGSERCSNHQQQCDKPRHRCHLKPKGYATLTHTTLASQVQRSYDAEPVACRRNATLQLSCTPVRQGCVVYNNKDSHVIVAASIAGLFLVHAVRNHPWEENESC